MMVIVVIGSMKSVARNRCFIEMICVDDERTWADVNAHVTSHELLPPFQDLKMAGGPPALGFQGRRTFSGG